jgi:hypothetical protein
MFAGYLFLVLSWPSAEDDAKIQGVQHHTIDDSNVSGHEEEPIKGLLSH